jgi:DNA repair protein RadD
MQMIELWEHQQRALLSVALSPARRLLVVAPTGSGKTTIGCELVRAAVQSGRTALWLAHRIELIDQAAERLQSYGIPCGIILACDERLDPSQAVQVASVQTLVRRQMPPAELVICDEAHHAAAPSYLKILDAYPSARIIGLTATPWRTDGRGLGDVFDDILVAAKYSELIVAGIIIRPTIYTQNIEGLARIRTIAGDYDQGALSELMGGDKLIGDALDMYNKHARGLSTIVYCVSKAHAMAVNLRYKSAGIDCAYLDCDTSKSEREIINYSLKNKPGFVVTQCSIYSEGVDIVQLFAVQVLRPTKSKTLWMQMAGRVMRTATGKTHCVILDHGGCVRRLGDPSKDRNYYLEPTRKIAVSSRDVESEDNGRSCMHCGAWIPKASGYCTALLMGPTGLLIPCAGCKVPTTIKAELVEYVPRQLAIKEPPPPLAAAPSPSPQDGARDVLAVVEGPEYRACEKCGSESIQRIGRGEYWAAAKCRACNHERWVSRKRKGEYTLLEMRNRLTILQGQAKKKGYKLGWANYEFARYFGAYPWEVGLSAAEVASASR